MPADSAAVSPPSAHLRTKAELQWAERWGASEQMGLAISIIRSYRLLMGRLAESLAVFDLSFSAFEILSILSFAREYSLPLGHISSQLMVRAATTSSVVKALETRGLVTTAVNPRDGRSRVAALTPAGLKLINRAAQQLVEDRFGLSHLTRAEVRELAGMLSDRLLVTVPGRDQK